MFATQVSTLSFLALLLAITTAASAINLDVIRNAVGGQIPLGAGKAMTTITRTSISTHHHTTTVTTTVAPTPRVIKGPPMMYADACDKQKCDDCRNEKGCTGGERACFQCDTAPYCECFSSLQIRPKAPKTDL